MRAHRGRRRARRPGPTRGPQHVFVNRRVVRDQTIAHAILDAYQSASIKERSPEVHLFLEVPLDRVDVNVHPTKAEVRFAEQSLVHEVVRRGVAEALGAATMPGLPPRRTGARRVGARRQRHRRLAVGASAGWPLRRPAAAGWPATAPEPHSRPTAPAWREPGRHRRHRPGTAARAARPVPQHLHRRHRRRGHRHHRSARRARAGAVRADPRAADRPARSRARGCWCRWCSTCPARDTRRCWRGPPTWRASASSSRTSAAPACGSPRCRRCSPRADVDRALRALADDLEGLDRGLVAEQAREADRRDDGLPRRREGPRPADHREDARTSSTSCGPPPIRRCARTAGR